MADAEQLSWKESETAVQIDLIGPSDLNKLLNSEHFLSRRCYQICD